MRMLICDMCGKEIEDHRKVRKIVCSRAFHHHHGLEEWHEDETEDKKTDKPKEVVWFKEVCVDCAMALDDYINSQLEASKHPEMGQV